MSKTMRGFVGLGVLAVLCTFLTSCGGRSPEKTVKIGILSPATGASATHGVEGLAGAEFALQDVNGRKNGPKVQYIVEDTHSKPADAVSATRKLIDVDGVRFIVGWLSSSDALAVAPVCERSKVLFFAVGTSAPELSGIGKYVFRHAPLASAQAAAAAQYIGAKLKPSALGVLYMNDATGKGYYDEFTKALSSAQKSPTAVEQYEKTATDFRTQIAKLKSAGCDCLYVPCVPRTLGQIIRQCREMDYKPKIVSNFGAEGQELIDIAGKDAEGIIYTSFDMSQEFVKLYQTKFDRKPQMLSALSYDSLNILVKEIAGVGDTPEAVTTALLKMAPSQGATGMIHFDQKHDAVKQIVLKTVKNGCFVKAEELE